MKKFDGWFFPDHEEHLIEWMTTVNVRRHDRLTYQIHKYDRAMQFVTDCRRAVDVGAHIGLWSFQMAWNFKTVDAFEPMPAHRECWALNMDGATGAFLYDCALGAQAGEVHIATRTANSSGDTGVEPSGDGVAVEMRTLDSFFFTDVDFVKIDCEGYELFVLQGARETLLRCRPTVIVEQKPETGGPERYGIGETDAVKYLQELGAVLRDGIQGDYILSWDK